MGIGYLLVHFIKNRWLIFLILLLAVITAVSVSILVNRDLSVQEEAIVNAGSRIQFLFEHEISMKSHTVKSMQRMAEQFLERDLRLPFDPVEYLAGLPEKGGFTLQIPPGYREENIGNITGTGNPPRPESLAAAEMAMALSLTPMFVSVIEYAPETPWVYYTSLDNFIYLFPRVAPEEFFFSDDLYELDFIKGASPEANRSREVFWSPVYLDAAGKGYMTTVSAPVYLGDRLCGSVSVDISISRIDWMLKRYSAPYSSIHLMYAGGQELQGTDPEPPAIHPENFPAGIPTTISNDIYTVYDLSVYGWYIVISTDRNAMIRGAFRRSVPLILMVIFICSGILLIVLLSMTVKRINILSTKDELTGLLNRRVFAQSMTEEFSRARRQSTSFGLIIFDIDFFKKYNDTYGHHEGDNVLRTIGKTIADQLERSTDKAFRVGGEEFVILALVRERQQLLAAMERIRLAVEGLAIAHEGSPLKRVTISLGGVLVVGTLNITFEEAYKEADSALYKSKSSGRNMSILAT